MANFTTDTDQTSSLLNVNATQAFSEEPSVRLTARDIQCLHNFQSRFTNKSSNYLNAFYRQLFSMPDANTLLDYHDAYEKLQAIQDQLITWLTGNNDLLLHIANRKQASRFFQEIGLQRQWLISAYFSLIDELQTLIAQEYSEDPAVAAETLAAWLKVICLDIEICGDTKAASNNVHFNEFLLKIIQNTVDGLIVTTQDGSIVFCNASIGNMFGYVVNELYGKNIACLMTQAHANKHAEYIENYIDSGRSKIVGTGMREVWGRHKRGKAFPLDIAVSEIIEDGERLFIAVLRDCSERKKDEAQMQKLSRALEQSADCVLITNNAGVIEYVNPAFELTTGFTSREALGNKPSLLKSGRQDEGFYKSLWNSILRGEVFRGIVINRKKNGNIYYEEKTISPLFDPQTGEITHYISTGKDITERMKTQQRLHQLAYYDELTELPNRTLYTERLNSAITRAQRHKRHIVVLLVNIDRFKTINDTLGYDAGDKILCELARRLEHLLRREDTVAYLGGNTFALLLEEISSLQSLSELAQKLLHLFHFPFHANEREIYTTASIGVSLYPQDGENSSNLIRNAEVAMYRAKNGGRNCYQFYTADMNAQALKRLEMETSLRKALERKEFILYYQPQVNLATGKIIGLETLVRWQHPELGLVMPDDFIPLLEETGLIDTASQWILEQACMQYQRWRQDGLPPLQISVNLSALQFRQRELVVDVANILSKTEMSPTALQLEVTESCIMSNEERVLRALSTFRRMGLQLALDDFGTGYSSLNYLKSLPVSTIKLDKSFVDGLPNDHCDVGIAKAVIGMAHNLGMVVVAEGVEREDQLNFLHQEGCDIIQGYIFSRPVPAVAVPDLLVSGKVL